MFMSPEYRREMEKRRLAEKLFREGAASQIFNYRPGDQQYRTDSGWSLEQMMRSTPRYQDLTQLWDQPNRQLTLPEIHDHAGTRTMEQQYYPVSNKGKRLML